MIHENKMQEAQRAIEIEKLWDVKLLECDKAKLEMQNSQFEALSSESKNLKTIQNIYKSLPLKNISLVNMSDKDPVGEILMKFKNALMKSE